MCVLTDVDLRARLKEKDEQTRLSISSYDEDCFSPVGYDLRAGGLYASSKDGKLGILGDEQPEAASKKISMLKAKLRRPKIKVADPACIILHPHSTTLVTTLEEITMPQDGSLSAFVFSKVRMVSKGLSHVSTTIDADWRGQLVVAIHNHSRKKIKLEYQQKFCTVVFLENKTKTITKTGKKSGRNDIMIGAFAKTNYLKEYKDWAVIVGFGIFGIVVLLTLVSIFPEKSPAISGVTAILGVIGSMLWSKYNK
jgi:deoxycytidine triphosphate deaminase